MGVHCSQSVFRLSKRALPPWQTLEMVRLARFWAWVGDVPPLPLGPADNDAEDIAVEAERDDDEVGFDDAAAEPHR